MNKAYDQYVEEIENTRRTLERYECILDYYLEPPLEHELKGSRYLENFSTAGMKELILDYHLEGLQFFNKIFVGKNPEYLRGVIEEAEKIIAANHISRLPKNIGSIMQKIRVIQNELKCRSRLKKFKQKKF